MSLALLTVSSCRYSLPVLRQGNSSREVKVRTVTVGFADNADTKVYVGKFTPYRRTTLRAPFPATVSSIEICRGGRAAAGATIVELESRTVRSAYEIAEAKYNQARDAYDRITQVYDAGGVSEVQMVDIRSALAQAQASFASAGKAVADCSVKAPYGCVVENMFVDEGVDVAAGQSLASLIDISSLKLVIGVNENDINDVGEGTVAEVDIPALGLGGIPARVTGAALSSSSVSHCYECTLSLGRTPSGVLPGMGAKVRFVRSGGESVVIPSCAVQMDAEGRYVWLNDAGTVRKARITVGGYAGKGIVVEDGLSEGDRVIVAGYQKVSSGMKVVE